MNIEQKTNMQELKEEEYTKVYGGVNPIDTSCIWPSLHPLGPIKPKRPTEKDLDI
ncbi:hypothetical protein [Alteromonas sp. V450]|uniref:hypothetical protein n=1 Tax=Alteromonas sp. V450 TaxID=1912139 RepID=UPI000B079A53|nr:hypothetical protein [Alteromonas sp. V450]|tara:strand:- start:78 stop:242 length:165 start_codon:yes stop_codon:yes gene_type:complete